MLEPLRYAKGRVLIATAVRTNGTERGPIIDMQRSRLLAATGQVARESGLAKVTVAHIVERAGVSRRTFYEIFTDCDDCLINTLQSALEQAQARVLAAWRSQGSWAERVRRSVLELLCLFDEEPVLAWLLIVESLAAGRDVLEQRARVLDLLLDAIDEGRDEASISESPARVGAEGALGGVLGILHARLTQHTPAGPLTDLAGVLTSMLVLPYRGPAAARRELHRPVAVSSEPRQPQDLAPLRTDPFKDAGMRLTYRTMRVLAAIADQPGSSNRQIGELAEMSDQGQVSKLLARLERAGLIANQSERHGKGDPNAWTLTAAGTQVTNRISAHAERQTA